MKRERERAEGSWRFSWSPDTSSISKTQARPQKGQRKDCSSTGRVTLVLSAQHSVLTMVVVDRRKEKESQPYRIRRSVSFLFSHSQARASAMAICFLTSATQTDSSSASKPECRSSLCGADSHGGSHTEMIPLFSYASPQSPYVAPGEEEIRFVFRVLDRQAMVAS